MSGPFWSVVKANITEAGRPSEDELSKWWSEEHVPLYVARDGFRRGRRVKTVEHEGQVGASAHEYLAVYEVDSVRTFNEALADGPPWGPWDDNIGDYIEGWERTYYRTLASHETTDDAPSYWTIVKADLDLADAEQEQAFDDWYTNTHMPEICSYEGVQRATRLRVEPDANDLGPRRQELWAIYEVGHPRDFVAARDGRAARGVEPWDGLWLPHVSNFEITFHELLYDVDHDAAVRKIA